MNRTKKFPQKYLSEEEIKALCKDLSLLGPKKIAITSVMTDENQMAVAVYDKEEDSFSLLDAGYIKRPFHGTGDIFAAVLTGALVNGSSMLDASQKAVDFIKDAISETMKYPDMKIEYGVIFEKALKNLI